MADSVIGALRVVLGADTAALDKGLRDSQSSLADFGSAVGIGMAAAAAAVAAAAYSIIGSVKSVVTSADQLNSLSQSLGIGVDQLSKLNYAAGLSGVGLEQLGSSLGLLTKAMSATAADGATPAAQAFAALGISVKNQDGTLKSASTVFGEISDKFAGFKDGANKTALAIAIFGAAGAKLIPTLNLSRDGLADASKEAESFGVVLDTRNTAAAAAFTENLRKLDAINQGLYNTIAAKLLPTLEALSQQYLDATKSSDLLSVAAGKIADFLNSVVRQVLIASVEVSAMITQFVNLGSAIAQIVKASSFSDMGKIWTDYRTAADAAGKAVDGVVESIRASTTISSESAASAADWYIQAQAVKALNREVISYGEAWKQAAPGIASASNAVQNFLDSQSKHIASQNADADAVGKNVGEQAKLRVEYEANAIATAKGVTINAELAKAISDTGNAASAAALKLQGMNLQQSLQAPWAQRTLQLEQYNAALTASKASTDAFAAASLKVNFPQFYAASQAARDFGAQIDQVVTSSINGLATALASVITGAKSAADAFKAFGLQVITQLIEMIIKAVIFKAIMTALGFAGGGPVSADQSLSSTGLSLATPSGLYASGGSVMGPGTATSDSIPAMLSNGEFVVNAQSARQFAPLLNAINSGSLPSFKDGGSVSGGNAAPLVAAPAPVVNLNWRGGITDRSALADLIDGLNGMFRNGYKLQLA